jgi:hypothetical protein
MPVRQGGERSSFFERIAAQILTRGSKLSFFPV